MAKPFHESVVNIIRGYLSSLTRGGARPILAILKLIEETTIPAGHDEIKKAIRYYFNMPGGDAFQQKVREVCKYLDEQKRLAGSRVSGDDRAKALMITIEKMIARHNNYGQQDDGFYQLVEIAKRLRQAKTSDDFQLAVEELNKFEE